MTRRSRRLVFYLLILVFLIGGAATALYAMGWRLDFPSLTPRMVGGIFLRSYPADASIVLDGEPVKNKTGFFRAGTHITGLYPTEYHLKLTAPNYLDWERTVTVKPALVTEVNFAVLVPDAAQKVISASNLSNFWLIGEEPLAQDDKGRLVLQDQTLPGSEVIGWTNDLTRLVTRDPKTNIYYSTDLRDATSTNITVVAREADLRIATNTKVIVESDNGNQILIHSTSSLVLLDIQRAGSTVIASTTPTVVRAGTRTTGTAPTTTLAEVAVSRFWISWSEYDKTKNESVIHLYDKFFGTDRELQPIGGRTVRMKWTNNILGFFQDDGEFYYYLPGSEKPVHLASDAQDFLFTSNGDMVAVLERKSLEVFSLRNKNDYWRYDSLPLPHRVTGMQWFKDNMHLIVSYPDRTVLLELDDLKLDNLQILAPSDKMHYIPERNEFYYLENGALMRLDFPQ